MRYRLVYSPEFKAMWNGLHEDDKQAVRVLLDAIAQAPELGDLVQAESDVFYQKTYWIDRDRWPKGVRVFYRYQNELSLVAIIDMGDHTTSGRFPGQSIYPDER